MSVVHPHEIIAMSREAIEVPSDDGYRVYEPGPVTLWVEGRAVGYLTPEQQLVVRDVIASGIVPPDLDAWLRSLGPMAGES